MLTEKEENIRKRIKSSNAFEHIKKLCEIGDRFAGSKGDREASMYVREQMEEFGLDVSKTEVPVISFSRNEVSLEILGDERISFNANPAYFSTCTPNGEAISAELVFVSSEESIEKAEVEGKIVVIQEDPEGEFWLGKYGKKAAENGAKGLIQIHGLPRAFTPSVEIGNHDIDNRFFDEQVPTISISSVDGGRLLYLIGKENCKVRLKVDVENSKEKSPVITGRKDGSEKQEEEVAIIAHRDNGIPPGANDNGSGTGTMLEIARVLSEEDTKRSVKFISSTAEEGVTSGAYNYVRSQEDKINFVKAIFNLDMFAAGGPINLVDTGYWPDHPPIEHSDRLNDLIDEIAEDLGYTFGRMDAEWGVSESGRFIEEGVPGVWFWRPDDPYYHSKDDTVGNIEPNSLKVVGDVTAIASWRLAEAKTFADL